MSRIGYVIAMTAAVASMDAVAEVDISNCPTSPSGQKSMSIDNSSALLVKLPDGAATSIQLTTNRIGEAAYRWRFRASGKSEVKAGSGRVFEVFPKRPGGFAPDNDPRNLHLIAGDIRIRWSAQDAGSGWIYYCPDLAKVEIIPLAAFNAKP